MAQAEEGTGRSKLASCDAYFETIQSRKKLPQALQETLTSAFARIPVSSFPLVSGGKGDFGNFFGFCNFNATCLCTWY